MNILDYLISFKNILNHPFNRHHKLLTISRILYWKLNQCFFHLPAVVEIEKGIKCICYPDSSYGGMVVYNRWAEYDVMASIIQSLGPNSIYVDVGANIGDTTVIAAAYTKGSIYAFEPSPVPYHRLVENIMINGLGQQILAEKLVLSDHIGTVNFSEMPTSETSHVSQGMETGVKCIKCQSVTLDSYTKRLAIKRIDLLKIDVEGAEMLVLKGSERLLAGGRIKHLILELNSASRSYGYTNSDVVKYLKRFKYRLPKLPKDIDGRIINIHARAPK